VCVRLSRTLQPVELRQQLRDDAVHDTARVPARASCGRQSIQLVEENHTWPCSARPCKYLTHLYRNSE
jgi:hypothetical protein